jgi:CubicO group peptidase (beta-lactamase class C family)
MMHEDHAVLDDADLTARLTDTLAPCKVPGAAAAVLHHGEVVARAAYGSANLRSGVEATVDTVFQIGSITKVWTATVVLLFAEEGRLDVDAPVRTYLPDFAVADPDVSRQVTLRHLLSHTSGIGGDHFHDTGRGDDVLERYVESCAVLGQEHGLGAAMSYCNSGYSVLGRILEVVDGKDRTWDAILRERLIDPLGLRHTGTLPEDALLHRAALGHPTLPGRDRPTPARQWTLARSAGPAGLITSTVDDLLAFTRLHLDGGTTADGNRLVEEATLRRMLEPQIDIPDRWTLGDRWGLGWILFDWGGHPGYGHDGATLGQYAFLRVLPETKTALVLLTNGGEARRAFNALATGVFADVAGVDVPPVPSLPAEPPDVDLTDYTGAYRRLSVDAELVVEDDGLVALVTQSGGLAHLTPPEHRTQRLRLRPVDRSLFLAAAEATPDAPPAPFVFFDFEGDRPRRFHFGARAMTRTG